MSSTEISARAAWWAYIPVAAVFTMVAVCVGAMLASGAWTMWQIVPISVLGALALLTYAVDFAASALGAKRFGASNRAVVGAAIGALVGIFFGLPGILLGPFVGATLGELSDRRGPRDAARAGVGATLGLALGAAAKLALAFSMLGIFALARFT